jgi:hypothetical protein
MPQLVSLKHTHTTYRLSFAAHWPLKKFGISAGEEKTRAKLSTLDVVVLVHALKLLSYQKQLNLKLKTWSKQLLGHLPLAFVLPLSFLFFYICLPMQCMQYMPCT